MKITGQIIFTIICFVSASTIIIAQSPESNENACRRYKTADIRLNRIYNKILEQYDYDKKFLENLRKEQQLWAEYTDAHIKTLWPDPVLSPHDTSGVLKYGSAYPMCKCVTLLQFTQERIKVLNEWISPKKVGDKCLGGSARNVNIRALDKKVKKRQSQN